MTIPILALSDVALILRYGIVQLPVLLVSVVGIVVSLVNWKKAPSASLWTFLAFLIVFILAIVTPLLDYGLMQSLGRGGDRQKMMWISAASGLITSIGRALSYFFLLIGAFIGRRAAFTPPSP